MSNEVNKNLTIEDVIAQMKEVFPTISNPSEPTKLLVSAAHMQVMRQMLDAGTLGNLPIMTPRKDIYEPEE
jgi:hypothetical protein